MVTPVTEAAARAACLSLATEALLLVAADGSNGDSLRRAIPLHSSPKDDRVKGLGPFEAASREIARSPNVQEMYGDPVPSDKLLLAFVYGFLARHSPSEFDANLFEATWNTFWGELQESAWAYYGVGNVQNFDGDSALFELADGVSIRHRDFDELRRILNWGDSDLEFLTSDWMRGGASGYVILARQDVAKEPDNLVLGNGPEIDPRILRTLLALRLLKPGAVGVGQIFHVRPSFICPPAGMARSLRVSPMWRTGSRYSLSASECPELIKLYAAVKAFGAISGDIPNVSLALRRFSTSFEREFSQAEDGIVDATIALEALLLRENDELAFRLAFRGSSILATDDDQRVSLFGNIRDFYSLRSKIVHGTSLKPQDRALIQNGELLQGIVRRLLRAFMIFAVAHPEFRKSSGQHSFYAALDRTLMHPATRLELRRSMGLESLPA